MELTGNPVIYQRDTDTATVTVTIATCASFYQSLSFPKRLSTEEKPVIVSRTRKPIELKRYAKNKKRSIDTYNRFGTKKEIK